MCSGEAWPAMHIYYLQSTQPVVSCGIGHKELTNPPLPSLCLPFTQAPYNTVTYSIIGDDQAPSLFIINSASGLISTSTRGLASDNSLVYRVRVLARDGGSPSLSATSTVIVNVDRNLNAPVFLRQNYTVTIFETQDLGVPIQLISAADSDVSVSGLCCPCYC